MPSLKALKISMIALLAITTLYPVLVLQAFSPSPLPFDFEHPEKYFVHYHAEEIGKPWQYWVLTDPDEYVLDVIAHAGDPPRTALIGGRNYASVYWVKCRGNETTFIYQVYEHGAIWEIEHEGHYYSVDCGWHIDPQSPTNPNRIILPKFYLIHNARHEKALAIGLAPILSVAWIALGTLWHKRTPQ